MKITTLIASGLLFITINIHAQQEKRLALVIGNANYDKGALNNPVNDALLMAKNLKSLDFDVILDTNIASIAQFKNTVRKFGEQRDKYDVGFIYYAGHGVQINGENYLLATKEKYASEYDVDDNALSVQKIMRFLTNKTSQVNVLILDACRDNPFEKNWNPQARSSDGGRGLAKIPAPTGSLIAYSTDAGNTAADGDGTNSIYCLSLTKNMQIENTTLDQVFRNVRTDVLKASGGSQRPVEASQLTGEAFYLKKGNYTDDIILIDSLIEEKQYDKGLEIAISILNEEKNNKSALIRKGRLYSLLYKNERATESLDLALKLFPNDSEVLFYRGRFYNAIGKDDQALKELNKAVEIDTNNADAYARRGNIHLSLEKFDLALADYTKAIALQPENANGYNQRAILLYKKLDEENKALTDLSKAIELEPENAKYWYNRGYIYFKIDNYKEALKAFEKVLKIDSSSVRAINVIGIIYERQGKTELAINTYGRGIALEKSAPESAATCYINRAMIYENQEKLELALADYTKAIALDPENARNYLYRAILYSKMNEENKALIDYSKAIELEPDNPMYWYNRGRFHDDNDHDMEALEDYEKALKIDPLHVNAINSIGVIYKGQGKIELAIETYERGMDLEKIAPKSAAFCYQNRAHIYYDQEKFELALADFSKAIALDPKNPMRYFLRAYIYDILEEENKALKDLSKAIELEPENTMYWYNRGIFHFENDHDKEALEDFEKVLKINPSYVNAINYIGIIYKNQGKIALAIETYKRGIALELTDPEGASYCYLNRARIYEKQGSLQQALQDLKNAIKFDPNNTDLYTKLGRFYQNQLDQPYDALNQFTKAINIDSSKAWTWSNRASNYRDLGNYKMAIRDCEYIMSNIDSNDVITLNWIGVYYDYLNKKDIAKKIYQRVIDKYHSGYEFNEYSIKNGIGWSLTNLALTHEEELNYLEAEELYDESVAIDSTNSIRLYWRSWFKFNCLQNTEGAVKDADKAVTLEPENIKFIMSKIKLLERSNRLDEAMMLLKKSNKKFPENEIISLELARFLGLHGNKTLSEKEFNKLSSMREKDSRFLNYQIELKMNSKDLNAAQKLSKECLTLFPKDTLSRTYLGDILFKQEHYPGSLREYTYLISMMENNDDYFLYYPHLKNIRLSELYIKQANTFEKMQDQQAQCDALKKALSNLSQLYGVYDKKKLKKSLEEKIKTLCN